MRGNESVRSVVADTHALLWYLTAPEMLSSTSRHAPENVVAAGGAIVATARANGVQLVTRDGVLTRYFPELCL